MSKKIILLFILIALSSLACVTAMDSHNSTDEVAQQDAQVLEAAVEQDDNATLSKSSDGEIIEASYQENNLSSAKSDESAYIVLDNDADKENICIGDYVTWIVSAENRGPGDAKGVKVFNQLPDGLKYVRHTATHGTFNPKTGIWDIGDLSNGSEVFLYITTLAVSAGEKINKANLTSQSPNSNNETYEEEEIDVLDCKSRNSKELPESKKTFHESSIRPAGNPIWMVLLALFGCFMAYCKK